MQFYIFHRYCRENGIEKDLFNRVLRYLQYAYGVKSRRIRKTDVELFKLLSEPLRYELQMQLYLPHLASHKLLDRLSKKDTSAMLRICHDALSELVFAREDIIFCAGEAAKHMLFVVDGQVLYRMRSTDERSMLHKSSWLSEACLWTAWLHVGTLTGSTECELLALDAISFGTIVREFPQTFGRVKAYAKRFVDHLNHRADGLTDLYNEDVQQFKALMTRRFDESQEELLISDEARSLKGWYQYARRSLREWMPPL